MSLYCKLSAPSTSCSPKLQETSILKAHSISSPPRLTFCPLRLRKTTILSRPLTYSPPKFNSLTSIRCLHDHGNNSKNVSLSKPSLENLLATAASLYPVYVTLGGVVACLNPSAFEWFVKRGPTSYSLSLGFIMLAMGVTLELKDMFSLFMQRPLSILFGCVAQYVVMPSLGLFISNFLGLSPALAVGLILLSCCPGGTASNVVTLIARGDVPLSIVMTVCTTTGAALLTPILTKVLAGTLIPVDAIGLSISTLQVVVAPILLGSYIQSTFPAAAGSVTPFAPLFAVLISSLLACSVFSENVVRIKSSVVGSYMASDVNPAVGLVSFFSGQLGLTVLSVVLLHFAGFLVGYAVATLSGFGEPQRRAISIEVGMQNSSLGVVLATTHFTSPMVALPAALSALIMNIMGSSLGFIWRHVGHSHNRRNVRTRPRLANGLSPEFNVDSYQHSTPASDI